MAQQLFQKAREGRVEEIEAWLRDNPSLDINAEEYGWTALHWASHIGNAEVGKLLLAYPALNVDLNVQTHGGSTPLCMACRLGWVPMVRLLLQDPRQCRLD